MKNDLLSHTSVWEISGLDRPLRAEMCKQNIMMIMIMIMIN